MVLFYSKKIDFVVSLVTFSCIQFYSCLPYFLHTHTYRRTSLSGRKPSRDSVVTGILATDISCILHIHKTQQLLLSMVEMAGRGGGVIHYLEVQYCYMSGE